LKYLDKITKNQKALNSKTRTSTIRILKFYKNNSKIHEHYVSSKNRGKNKWIHADYRNIYKEYAPPQKRRENPKQA